MKRTAIEYGDEGLTTLLDVWIVLVTFASLAIVSVVIDMARTHDYWAVLPAAFWITGSTTGLVNALRQFTKLQPDPQAPTTRLLFRVLSVAPIMAFGPLLFQTRLHH